MSKVPSVLQRYQYASALYAHFGMEQNIDPVRIADTCDYFATATLPDLNCVPFLLASEEHPIFIRREKLIGYPHPKYLIQLCESCIEQLAEFERRYHAKPARKAWLLGAYFRSVKPFNRGNAIIGHLIENWARQQNDLSWRLSPATRDEFRKFHLETFVKNNPSVIYR